MLDLLNLPGIKPVDMYKEQGANHCSRGRRGRCADVPRLQNSNAQAWNSQEQVLRHPTIYGTSST